MARNSWRFVYGEFNKSFKIEETETAYTAFWAIRAPKGDVEARYIPPHNPDLIKMMFGCPSADYPDIYNLLDFNNLYGVQVSAAPGTSKDIPNFYGGVYNTVKGLLPSYGNESKSSPSYLVSIKPATGAQKVGDDIVYGSEIKSKLHEAATIGFTTALNTRPDEQAVVTITGIPADVIRHTDRFVFDWWGTSSVTGFKYILKTIGTTDGVLKPDPDMFAQYTSNPAIDVDALTHKTCGTFKLDPATQTYTITLGITAADSLDGDPVNTKADAPYIPFIDYTSYNGNPAVYNYSAVESTAGAHDERNLLEGNEATLLEALLTGGVAQIGNTTIDYKEKTTGQVKPLAERFRLLYNVQDITVSFAMQSSPTAIPTVIKFTDFVYDKYLFDVGLPYTDTETDVSAASGDLIVIKNNKLSIWGWNPDAGEVGTNGEPVGMAEEVSDSYDTRKIAVLDPYTTDVPETLKEFRHNIYAVDDGGLFTLATEDNGLLEVNPMYNSFSIEAVETDEYGEEKSSSVFSGSLDPKAETENGQDFFFEDVFVPDQASYITHRVTNTFDNFLDEKGFYTGYRVQDVEGEITVKGQRYLDYVIKEVKDLHAKDIYGCFNQMADATPAIQKKLSSCIKQSLVEAQKGKYEDCFLLVDPSGSNTVKELYGAIRTNHNMMDIISVNNINESLFQKISKTPVYGRVRGGIQICQEFQFRDANKVKYWDSVIGAYATMVMKTIESTRGGKQPCWINENDIGGQLDALISSRALPSKQRWDFDDAGDPVHGIKADTEVLDLKGINPIILDPVDGVMVLSGVTTELNAGDWSRVKNAVAFDCCKRELRDEVMKPQIEKAIDDYYIGIREDAANDILRKRTNTYKIWTYAKADCKNCNTDLTKAQEIFNLDVEVRVKPTSRKVKLNFTNLAQVTLVKD